jgi:sugar phosphate isomerase/epimerase
MKMKGGIMDHRPEFGVSTFWLQGISIEEAIERSLKQGFTAFEVTTSSLGIVGFPAKPSAGVDLFSCDKEARKVLREALSPFSSVSVHACHFGVNIASVNSDTRKASWERYFETIKFAADIGAEIVTFQPGFRERQVDEQMETVERNIEFSKEAVKLAQELGLVLGFQNLPAGARGPMNSKAMLNEIFREVDDPALGLLFDPAWAIKERALSSTDMTGEFILPWFEELGLKIIKLHVHGILACNPFGYLHHQPLWQDNCHDFPLLVSYIKRYSPRVPLIFKIIGRDADTALRLAKEGLDYLGGLF